MYLLFCLTVSPVHASSFIDVAITRLLILSVFGPGLVQCVAFLASVYSCGNSALKSVVLQAVAPFGVTFDNSPNEFLLLRGFKFTGLTCNPHSLQSFLQGI